MTLSSGLLAQRAVSLISKGSRDSQAVATLHSLASVEAGVDLAG